MLFPLAAGCATQSDIQLLRQDVQQARQQAADAQATTVTVRRELETLRGEFEQLRFQAGSSGRAEDLVAHLEALDARVAALEQGMRGGAMPSGTLGEGGPPAMGPGAPDLVGRGLEAETSAPGATPEYREAVELLRRGSYQEAIPRFREFLRRSPKSDLADNAQYWIGEAYYGMRDYNRAILEFNEVLLRYPKGDKVPAALLRQAFAFADLGDKVDARLVLQKLVSEHGGTPEAEQGRQKLAELSS
ncbi:MAG: tol-pal system protein YbgF [Candidatus Binatia bacterium]